MVCSDIWLYRSLFIVPFKDCSDVLVFISSNALLKTTIYLQEKKNGIFIGFVFYLEIRENFHFYDFGSSFPRMLYVIIWV